MTVFTFLKKTSSLFYETLSGKDNAECRLIVSHYHLLESKPAELGNALVLILALTLRNAKTRHCLSLYKEHFI
jgi:hypothetical protein